MGDGLPRRIVAGHGEDHEEVGELLAAQSLAVGAWPDEPAGDVPEVLVHPRLGGGVGVGEHLDDAGEVGAGVLGILAARHLVAPAEELWPVVVGDAHEAGNGLQRQMAGHIEHEVARALPLRRPHDAMGTFT